MPTIRKAAEFLLHKTDPPIPRTERLVALVSDDWEELRDILVDPSGKLFDMRNDWGDGQDPKDWRLKPDAVGTFQCGYRNVAAAKRVIKMLGIKAPPPVRSEFVSALTTFANFEVFSEFNYSWVGGVANHLVDLMAQFVDGGFLLEFAIDTRILTVNYFPPLHSMLSVWRTLFQAQYDAVMPPLPVPAPKVDRYVVNFPSTPFSKGTFAYSYDNVTGKVEDATFHFDIKRNRGARADFVVGYLENPVGVLNTIRTKFEPALGNSEFYRSNFIDKGQPMNGGLLGDIGFWGAFNLDRGGWSAINPSDNEQALLATFMAMPSMVVEGFSAQPPSDPCTQWVLVPNGDGTYTVQAVTVKAYN